MTRTIFFDMDGTIADLYNVEGWLDDLTNERVRPYKEAKALVNLSTLARVLNKLQDKGYRIEVISWLSKNGTDNYNKKTEKAKRDWLNKHLHSVRFDAINIVKYGTAKQSFIHTTEDILFDDEVNNRTAWTGKAYDVNNILEVLKNL